MQFSQHMILEVEGKKIISIKSHDGRIHFKLGQKIFSKEIRHSKWINNYAELVTGWGLITKIYEPSINQQIADATVRIWPENWFMGDDVNVRSILDQEEVLQKRTLFNATDKDTQKCLIHEKNDSEKMEELKRLNKSVFIFRCILFLIFISSTHNMLCCLINNASTTSKGTIIIDTFCYGTLAAFSLVYGIYLKKIFLCMDKHCTHGASL